MSGIAGGADVILIPEQPMTVEAACEEVRRRHARGKNFSIVVVSEGYELTYADGESRVVGGEARASDQFGHVTLGGVGEILGHEIEQRTGFETRVTVLGHVQRGGSPTPRDRVLATRFGLKAAELAHAGQFGQMAALRGDDVIAVSLEEATAQLKTVTPEWYAVARRSSARSSPLAPRGDRPRRNAAPQRRHDLAAQPDGDSRGARRRHRRRDRDRAGAGKRRRARAGRRHRRLRDLQQRRPDRRPRLRARSCASGCSRPRLAIRLVHGLRERLPGIVFAVEHEAFAHEPGFAAWGWEPPAGTRVGDCARAARAIRRRS